MPQFIPGLELSRLFNVEAVRPILDREFPGLCYSAARIVHDLMFLCFLMGKHRRY
ncbi:MAG: hypothetical protein R3293_19240 [Candidatus Promineifilaceae bacterium]|nr:hypothetical protein [Candidatus Promineifilaceae bacterium]